MRIVILNFIHFKHFFYILTKIEMQVISTCRGSFSSTLIEAFLYLTVGENQFIPEKTHLSDLVNTYHGTCRLRESNSGRAG